MNTLPNKKSAAMDDSLPPKVDPGRHSTAETQDKTSASKGRLLKWVKKIIPEKQNNNDSSLREAIEELIEEENTPKSSVAAHERHLISNILQLRDLPVIDVMVPRADIVYIDSNASREELFQLLAERPHSRLPVCKGNLDNILGIIHIKDLVTKMTQNQEFVVRDIIRDAMVVSPAMRVMDLLLQMRQSKVHIAFVVDEFGGIDGLITINDLIEAIVGEIDDEFDFDIAPQLFERPDGTAIADARYPITEFEKRYGNLFHEDDEHEDVDTLGGLANFLAGHVPSRGEIVRHSSGIEFEIIDADPRRVMRLRIRNLPKKSGTSE